jgi:hypothetical protein
MTPDSSEVNRVMSLIGRPRLSNLIGIQRLFQGFLEWNVDWHSGSKWNGSWFPRDGRPGESYMYMYP